MSTATTNRNDEISGEAIYHPHENDILLGRGGNNNKHIGNEQLRVMALDRVHKYMKCTKTQKTRMVHELVASMKNLDPPARFIRRNSSGEWFEASNKFAKEKVSQVFRDALAKIELQKIGGSYRIDAHSIGTESTISYEPISLHRYLNEGDNGSFKHYVALPKANQNLFSTSQTESCTMDSIKEGACSTNNDECDFDITYSRHKIVDMNLDPDETYNLADISTDEISDLFMDEELTLDFLGTNLFLL